MKQLTFIFLTAFFSLFLNGQDGKFAVCYGMNVTQFYTGSGHGSAYIMNSNIQKGRKSLEMGMIYQENDKRVSGGNAKYKVYFGRNPWNRSLSKTNSITFKPYIHYNCIYQSSKVNTPDIPPSGSKKSNYPELPSSPGTIASMEHYAGIGLQLFVSKNICVDGSMGMGAYIGSLNHTTRPATLGIHNENSGFVLAFDFGIGYIFGI